MSSNNDSIGKTFFVVIALCLVCAIIVSTAAVQLRPKQQENKLLDTQVNILRAAGLMTPGGDISALYQEHIVTKLINLDTGEEVTDIDPLTYDYRRAMKDPAASISLSAAEDKASIRTRANIAPVYFAYNDGKDSGEFSSIILPVHGYGLWSTMHAFLALETDANTIIGLNYYEHGETPGLGGEIQNPIWRAQFAGKKLFDDAGNPAIRVMKPGNAAKGSAHDVDGLSGATLTSNGVQHTFDFWAGEKGFAKFLANVRAGKGA